MKRTLIYVVALGLVAATSIPTDYASARAGISTHVDSTLQFPQGKTRNFRHTIRLHILQDEGSISQLTIDVPVGLIVRNDITITDQSGKQINTNVSVNDGKVILTFSEPVASETKLNIALNRVLRIGISNAWLYRISEKFAGSNTELSIGTAQFRVY